ncbi:hypothetical protein [Psychroflexus tropicus]|nr:hypothetical protein [Psychroflexus tropicus]
MESPQTVLLYKSNGHKATKGSSFGGLAFTAERSGLAMDSGNSSSG